MTRIGYKTENVIRALAENNDTGRITGVLRRIPPDPPALPTDPLPFLVPAAGTILDVFALESDLTVHEEGKTTFTAAGGVFSIAATDDGHFSAGAYTTLVDFDRDSPGVVWSLDIEVGYLLGTGGETIVRTIRKDGIVSNQGLRVALNHSECAAGPDSPLLTEAPGYDGILQIRYRIAHDAGGDQTISIHNALVCTHPVALPLTPRPPGFN